RDDKYIDNLISHEKEFWDRVQNLDAPPLIDKDYESKDDEDWEKVVLQYMKCYEIDKKNKEELEMLREQLITMSNGRNAQGAGLKLTASIRKGNISYDQIPELKNINLEQYRKAPTKFYRLSF